MKGETIRQVRELLNMRQEDLASSLGAAQKSISQIEQGIPALKRETIEKICKMLHINTDFIYDENNYIFNKNSFLKMRVKGLNNRISPLKWFDLLTRNSELEEVKVLLLCNKIPGNILAAMVKDSMNSVFLVRIDIPLKIQSLVDHIRQNKIKHVRLKGITIFEEIDGPVSWGLDELSSYNKEEILSIIEKQFKGELTAKEHELLSVVRKNPSKIDMVIDFAKKIVS